MSGFKSLIGKKMQKKVPFMGDEVTISKLSVAMVMDIQAKAKDLSDDDSEAGFDVLMTVIRSAVEGAEEMSEEQFNGFPMDELSKLSTAVMKFSGIEGEKEKVK